MIRTCTSQRAVLPKRSMRPRSRGKVRFVGFTGHKSPAIHLKMLAHDYPFDTVQMPLNCFDATYRSFEQQVLLELQRRGIAALGMKNVGGRRQPYFTASWSKGGLRYAMSLPVASTYLRYRFAGCFAPEHRNSSWLQTDVAPRNGGAS